MREETKKKWEEKWYKSETEDRKIKIMNIYAKFLKIIRANKSKTKMRAKSPAIFLLVDI